MLLALSYEQRLAEASMLLPWLHTEHDRLVTTAAAVGSCRLSLNCSFSMFALRVAPRREGGVDTMTHAVLAGEDEMDNLLVLEKVFAEAAVAGAHKRKADEEDNKHKSLMHRVNEMRRADQPRSGTPTPSRCGQRAGEAGSAARLTAEELAEVLQVGLHGVSSRWLLCLTDIMTTCASFSGILCRSGESVCQQPGWAKSSALSIHDWTTIDSFGRTWSISFFGKANRVLH